MALGIQISAVLNIVCTYLVGLFAEVISCLQGFCLHRTSVTLKNENIHRLSWIYTYDCRVKVTEYRHIIDGRAPVIGCCINWCNNTYLYFTLIT